MKYFADDASVIVTISSILFNNDGYEGNCWQSLHYLNDQEPFWLIVFSVLYIWDDSFNRSSLLFNDSLCRDLTESFVSSNNLSLTISGN